MKCIKMPDWFIATESDFKRFITNTECKLKDGRTGKFVRCLYGYITIKFEDGHNEDFESSDFVPFRTDIEVRL